MEEQSCKRNDSRDGGAETAAAGHEAGEKGQDGEDERDQVEDPAESPHVVVVEASGVAAVRSDDRGRRVRRVARPRPSQRRSGRRAAAICVAVAADVEISPLGNGPRAGDAVGVGPEKVGFPERRG